MSFPTTAFGLRVARQVCMRVCRPMRWYPCPNANWSMSQANSPPDPISPAALACSRPIGRIEPLPQAVLKDVVTVSLCCPLV